MESKARKEVFTMSEREGHTFWTKVGIAFPNRDGSMNLYLDALPVNGRLQLRDPKPRDEQKERPPYVNAFEPAQGIQ